MSPHLWGQPFRFVHRFANLALSSLFEPPCAACGGMLERPLDGAVCDLCWTGIHWITPPVCRRCGDPLASSHSSLMSGATCRQCGMAEHAVEQSRAIGPYEGRLRDIIHAFKYDGRRSIAPRLASMMRKVGEDMLRDADCLVPVPLHPRRERARGFNQADDLARQLGLPVTHLLRRTVATRPQVDLPALERERNVRDAFAINDGRRFGPVMRWDLLAQGGRHPLDFARGRPADATTWLRARGGGDCSVIVLVDDVTTTGSTLEACARVLKSAGVREVRALTAARVVSGRL